MKLHQTLLVAASALLLSACFDDLSDDEAPATPQPTNEVPAGATASVAAYTQYTASLPSSETAEPLQVNQVTPPTSETAEPLPL